MDNQVQKLGLAGSFAIYIPAAILMVVLTKYLIPYLSEVTGQETILFWFLVAGLGIFTPLIIAGWLILKSEGYSCRRSTLAGRLRFGKVSGRDWAWALGGLAVAGLLSGLVMMVVERLTGGFDHSPAFMSFEPLSAGRYWLLLVWLPYWLLNILGEEILWRGVMLPRQEAAFGEKAWLVHGVGWGLFHIAFGWQLLLTLLPLMYILPYVAQKTRNSWVGVIMHAGLNGPSFIAISLGLM
ncbi:MAG: CPBP family intramembrane glutamic endopeptidase [Bacteroidota bacterium]